MWIKREKYENLLKESTLTSHLRAEVEYWRGKFESERERADRIGDRVFEVEGRAPVSTMGMAEARMNADEMKRAVEAQVREMGGAFEEDDPSEFIVNEMIKITPEAAAALGKR